MIAAAASDLLGAVECFATRVMEIAPERVLRVMGYRQGASIRRQIRGAAEAMASLAATVATPAACYRRLPIASCDESGLVLATGSLFRGPTFAAYLSDCREVAVFVLSLGERFDTTQKQLAAAEQTLEAYVLEIAGWLAIEQATQLFREHLDAAAQREGLGLTRRLAPGYTSRVGGRKVEWPLEDQPQLFGAFGASVLPARLLEDSCAMTPKMSRSGLYGLHPAPGAGTRVPALSQENAD